MLISQKYTIDTLDLVRSFIIKIHILAVSMNKELHTKYNLKYDSDDMTTWPYYLNISGQPHDANTRIEVLSLDTNEIATITINNIDKHPRTKSELLKYGTYYKDLIDKYRGQELYIRGIISPIDINTAISAKDGTILSYDKSKVEYNEQSLIFELERAISRFISRWNIDEYLLVDDLYIPALYNTLIGFIIRKVFTLRIKNINTYEIHSKYQYDVVNSYLGTSDFMSLISNEARLWLVKNLPYITYNIGKDDTFNSVIKHVLVPSGIKVSELNIIPTAPIKISDDINHNSYIKNKETLYDVSKVDTDANKSNVSLTTVNMSSPIIKDLRKYYAPGTIRYGMMKDKIINNSFLQEKTKVYILEKNEIEIGNSAILSTIALELTILYTVVYDTDKSYDIVDIYGVKRSVSSKELGQIVLYLLKELSNIDKDIVLKKFQLKNLINEDFDISALLSKVIVKDSAGTDLFTNKLNYLKGELPIINNNADPKEVFKKTKEFYYGSTICIHNMSNLIRSAEMDAIISCVKRNDTFDINPKQLSIGELTQDFKIDKRDDMLTYLGNIIYGITGHTVDVKKKSLELLKQIEELVKNLTSYTIYPIAKTKATDTIFNRYTIGIPTDLSIAAIIEAKVDCVGIQAIVNKAYGDDDGLGITVVKRFPLSIVEDKKSITPTLRAIPIYNNIMRFKPILIIH